MTFHVGQKVVCIVGEWQYPPTDLKLAEPRRGGIYHVRCISHDSEGDYLLLAEIVNPMVPGYRNEPDFAASGFRPVVEKKTDISIFTKLLTPNPQRRELVSSVIGEDINTL